MKPKPQRKFYLPPVVKLLVRGYLIISFILALEHFGIIASVSFTIFLVTIISVSMVFGVGYLLVMSSRPVRSCAYTIPNTTLFFVKGIMVLYFVSLLAQFGFLPGSITAIIMTLIALIMTLAGMFSYLWEVFERSRPLPKPRRIVRAAPKPKIR
jgi:hypothetical protein